ncbi:hypothetical protein I7I53_02245 [Histoplasma capsulatum var. duboisii H88]|uniref:Secreted protein n=1 Tax=Ajellomyces capsulatus (strain H88) TaxID=544711 RepID=A0A8A1LKW4_AJEC8|nr:hypothetical protein I7I53_02245 [Histoplasma capsulatum var. duboisii H88]
MMISKLLCSSALWVKISVLGPSSIPCRCSCRACFSAHHQLNHWCCGWDICIVSIEDFSWAVIFCGRGEG